MFKSVIIFSLLALALAEESQTEIPNEQGQTTQASPDSDNKIDFQTRSNVAGAVQKLKPWEIQGLTPSDPYFVPIASRWNSPWSAHSNWQTGARLGPISTPQWNTPNNPQWNALWNVQRNNPGNLQWNAPWNAQWNAPIGAQWNAPWNAQWNSPIAAQWNAPVASQWNSSIASHWNSPIATRWGSPIASRWNSQEVANKNLPWKAQWRSPVGAPYNVHPEFYNAGYSGYYNPGLYHQPYVSSAHYAHNPHGVVY